MAKKEEVKLKETEYGEVLLGKSPSIIFQRNFPAQLQTAMVESMGAPALRLLYQTAKENASASAKAVADSIVGMLGKLDRKRMAEEMLKQFPKRGYGIATLESIDPSSDRIVISVDNCFNAPSEKDPNHTCAIAAGILAGAAFSVTGKEMDAVETNCVARGDPYCRFELNPVKGWK